MFMSNGGFRPNSGRKKGSIPWNKGIKSGNHGNGFKKGVKPWNYQKSMSETMREKMRGNKNGKGNKGIKRNPETIIKMKLALKGRRGSWKGKKIPIKLREKFSIARKNYFLRINPDYDISGKSFLMNGKRIRRERIKKFGGCHSIQEWETLKSQYNWTCPCCKKQEPTIKLTRDHIIAIAKGGSDNIENIQPLCVSCNSKKSIQTIKY